MSDRASAQTNRRPTRPSSLGSRTDGKLPGSRPDSLAKAIQRMLPSFPTRRPIPGRPTLGFPQAFGKDTFIFREGRGPTG